MLSWYIDSSRTESKYIEVVNRNVQPCMDYFCMRLLEMEVYDNDEILKVFKEIIEELPIMTAKVYNNEFIINYNRWVNIKLTETPIQIYRESKIRQILE